MLKLLASFLGGEPLKVPMRYFKRLGHGRTVSVFVTDRGLELDNLLIKFERKIEAEDVINGRLRKVAIEEVRKRGGKRLTAVAMSYETAEALHEALSSALKDARKRQARHDFNNKIMSYALCMTERKFS